MWRTTHFNLDLLVGFDAEQVDVDRAVRDRVHLDRLWDHELLFALVDQCCRRGQEMPGFDGFHDFREAQVDCDGLFGAPIKDAWDEAIVAGFTRAAGTDALTHFDIE